MKKAILVCNRKTKTKEGNNCLWLTMYELPRLYKTKTGTTDLWYPKKDEALLVHCVDETQRPDDYQRLIKAREGAICCVHFAINDMTNKAFISQVDILSGTDNHSPDILYKTE